MPRFKTDFRLQPPKILVHPLNAGGSGNYRFDQPAKALQDAGMATVRVDPRWAPTDVLLAMQPDVVVLPAPSGESGLASMQRYAKELPDAFLVLDLDDKLWGVPSTNPASASLPKDMLHVLRKAVAIVHRVTVSTEPLRQAVIKDLKVPKTKAVVVQNCISSKFVNAARSSFKERGRKRLRVGWAGGISHKEDLAELHDVVVDTADRYQWVFMGCRPDGVDESLYEYHEAVDFADYPRVLGELDLDIAVAPLADTPFNNCKSDLRVLEFAACGYPVVASDNVVFEDAVAPRGLLMDRSPNCWAQGLEIYADLPRLREGHAQTLNDWLLAKRMQENPKNLDTWIEAWLPTGAQAFKPGAYLPESAPGLTAVDGGYVYTRRGSKPPAVPLEPIMGAASISVLHNDGIFPQVGSYTPLTEEASKVIPVAAATLDEQMPIVPQASGTHVLLTNAAVSRIGFPDTGRFGTVEAALVDWSVRATRAGFRHHMSNETFVEATEPMPNAHLLNFAKTEVTAWHPEEVFKSLEAIGRESMGVCAKVLRELDAAAFSMGNPPTGEGKRIMLINGDVEGEVREGLKKVGHSVLHTALIGHLMTLDPRFFPHAEAVDMRRDFEDLIKMLAACDITDVVLAGLYEGSVDVLATIYRLRYFGFQVTYIANGVEHVCPRVTMHNEDGPCGIQEKLSEPGFDADRFCTACIQRCGSPYGFVNIPAWRSSWHAFLQNLAPITRTENEEVTPE